MAFGYLLWSLLALNGRWLGTRAMQGTQYERVIVQIERAADPAMLEMGFMPLSQGGRGGQQIHQGIAGITAMCVFYRAPVARLWCPVA